MAKAKFADVEEAKLAKSAAKEELELAKADLKSFCKENGLEKGVDHSEHEKHGKRFSKIQGIITKKEGIIADINAAIEEFKTSGKKAKEGKSTSSGRLTKYEYPADCVTDLDKKKFRAAARRGTAPAAGEGTGEGKKKSKKSEAPKEEGKKGKKKDKSGKKSKSAPAEAED